MVTLKSSSDSERPFGVISGFSRALESSHEMRWVGPLMFDTMGRILISGPVLWGLMRW